MLERSKKYDRAMVRKCMAGPNALYLTEELTDSMRLEAGMLVLDETFDVWLRGKKPLHTLFGKI